MNLFSIVPIEVCLDDRLTKMQLRVLIALLSFRNKNTDTCFPKRKALSAKCGYTEQTISKVTKQLVDLGWLQKEGLGGYSAPCTYRITVPELETVSKVETVSKPATKTVSEPATITVSEVDTRKEQTIEQTNEQTINNTSDQDRTLLFDELWSCWPVGYGDKGSRKNALNVYLKLKPDKTLHSEMLGGLFAQAKDKQIKLTNNAFASNFPHVERWLKNRRWEDEISVVNFSRTKPTREQRIEQALNEAFGTTDTGSIEGDFETIVGNGFAELNFGRGNG
jgi:hypothetical protein